MNNEQWQMKWLLLCSSFHCKHKLTESTSMTHFKVHFKVSEALNFMKDLLLPLMFTLTDINKVHIAGLHANRQQLPTEMS